MNVQEMSRREQFHLANGGEPVKINGWHWYPNGARMEENVQGALISPPSDPLECAKRKAIYQEVLLKRATEAFREANQQLRYMLANNRKAGYGPPPQESLDQLEALLATVRKHQAAVKAAHAEIEECTPKQAIELKQFEAERAQEMDAFAMKLDLIKL